MLRQRSAETAARIVAWRPMQVALRHGFADREDLPLDVTPQPPHAR
jgi:hypothetical protein